MASISDLYRRRQGTSPTTCAPPQPSCSTCGMLECACRPRFFAGQVLNADDLNRLDAYIRAKNGLHNRQLHGWGVVNGLEVMCNPCGDGVAVGCGYALSPCGDDIVVCDAVTVPVCDLIRRCKDSEARRGPCAPFQHPQVAGCDAAEEEWILAIRYAETPQRGVKPLYAPTQADCGCSCGKTNCTCGGGAMKAACGCGAKSASPCTCGATAKPRGAPVQCEATVICEGFEFEVYRRQPVKKPEGRSPTLNPDSPLIKRFQCCYDELVTKAPKVPAPFTPAAVAADPNAWYLWACRFQAHLLQHFQYSPGYNCALLARLSALVIVQPTANGGGVPALIQAVQLLLLVTLDGLFACLCSALLPPCPLPTDETRVPLAALHVANNPCHVVRVCNWVVERKFATTFPALQYWLSVLPYGAGLRQLLQTLCCFDVTSLFRNVDPVGVAGAAGGFAPQRDVAAGAAGGPAPAEAANAGGPDANASSDFFHQQGLLRLNPTVADAAPWHDASALLADVLGSTRPLEPETLMNAMLAAQSQGRTLSPVASANLPQFLLLNQIAKPMAQAALGSLGKAGLGGLERSAGQAPAGAGSQTPTGGGQTPAGGASQAPASGESQAPAGGASQAPAGGEARTPSHDDGALAAMRAQIAKLQATIERHATEIEHLRSGGGGPRPKRGPR